MLKEKPQICTFESRRAEEMKSLIERFGGSAVVAPSMQEVPIETNQPALQAIQQIIDGNVDWLVLLTGVGTDAMLELARSQNLETALLDAMSRVPLLIRGPKPAAVLKRLELKYRLKAPEPNTWRELLAAMDEAEISVADQTVAVQEYGIPNKELYDGLKQRGAKVLPVPVYRWALPDNLEPLQQAIQQTVAGELDALVFTSAQQVRHVLQVADQMQQRDAWLEAASLQVIASIGPTCSETLQEVGLPVTFEACPPKMGPLVRGVIAQILVSRRPG